MASLFKQIVDTLANVFILTDRNLILHAETSPV
uniref:Uncharacterized protein n=1 Tax=Sphingobacterium sp. (strain 21) TaxID=743722 RepID=F4C5G5_SPHS2